MLTPEGVWVSWLVLLNRFGRLFYPRFNLPEKIHFVPHMRMFVTGSNWELFVRRVLKISTVIALLWFLYSLLSATGINILPFDLYFS